MNIEQLRRRWMERLFTEEQFTGNVTNFLTIYKLPNKLPVYSIVTVTPVESGNGKPAESVDGSPVFIYFPGEPKDERGIKLKEKGQYSFTVRPPIGGGILFQRIYCFLSYRFATGSDHPLKFGRSVNAISDPVSEVGEYVRV